MNIAAEKLERMLREMAVNDSHEAFKTVYLAYYSRLMAVAFHYVRSEQAAEDIVADTFRDVWTQRSRLPDLQNFNAYICQMVRNKAVSYFRKNDRRTDLFDSIETQSLFYTPETPETELLSSELMTLLNQAIDRLPDRNRLVFKLIREENLRYKEVAQMLDISIKTIEAHMTLAIKRLRSVLAKNRE